MSLSRSPSPRRGDGGWASPGLTPGYDDGGDSGGGGTGGAAAANGRRPAATPGMWTPRARGATTGDGSAPSFVRHIRNLSGQLPYFRSPARDYANKEKLGRGRWNGSMPSQPEWRRRLLPFVGRVVWRLRVQLALLFTLIFFLTMSGSVLHFLRGVGFIGGGSRYVILLATNLGGGVMEWKGPKEWAIERDSIRNKKAYARRWGYELEMVDMSTKKKYAHEWRESWEKVDMIREAMRKYPRAEWFWWLDLHTFIMEPSYSLQSHIFKNLKENTYRDINVYNPLNISHPPTEEYLDAESRSAVGDGNPNSINLIIPQDCGGFNLGSFLVRRAPWTDRLLDIWWDPVGYEQKHMQWEHKEQDALEWMYEHQPWVRSHVGFVPQRRINSFPPGACGDQGINPKIHYNDTDRDFIVNMAGCEWGRDCWAEMYEYRRLSERLNRPWLLKQLSSTWDAIRGKKAGAMADEPKPDLRKEAEKKD